MENKIKSVLGMLLFVILLLAIFPEYITKILEDKFYTLIAGMIIILLSFFIWLLLKER